MAAQKTRPPSFKISIPGGDDKKQVFLEKMQTVRELLRRELNRPVNNGEILEHALDKFISLHMEDNVPTPAVDMNTYIQVPKRDVNQKMFISAISSIEKLVKVSENHGRMCRGYMITKKVTMKGHVAAMRLTCNVDQHHSVLWSSSPYLPNNEYLVNYRVFHGYSCSGVLPIHYIRFCNGANIGLINKENRKKLLNVYKGHVTEEYNSSIRTALQEEIASYEDLDGINISTDARHGWRKNAKDSSIVAIGESTHKVLKCEHVTKSDDKVSQRHERIGTVRLYLHFDANDVPIKVHTHDRNMSINKFVRENQPATKNQNDVWHSVKTVKINMKAISQGPAYKKGSTWSDELDDKVEPVATHMTWAINNCEKNANTLRSMLENTVEHYKNNHSSCHPTSRCKKDPNYEPSCKVITDPKTEHMLLQCIKKSTVYKDPENYVLGKNTYHVESFNNVMNIFQDKRISFGDDQYKMRSDLAVCHWNENVDREFTSVWNPPRRDAPRSKKGKKVYKALKYSYRDNIWERMVNSVY